MPSYTSSFPRTARIKILTCASILLAFPLSHGYDTCCQNKLLPYIPVITEDSSHTLPDVNPSTGEPRLVPDPKSILPQYWDEEDDGVWEPDMIPNPRYEPPVTQLQDSQQTVVPNPKYTPPSLASRLEVEIRSAIPWVVLGVLLSTLLSYAMKKNSSVSMLSGFLSKSGPTGGSLLGLVTPLCSCGSLPLASTLSETNSGSLGAVVSFVTATQCAGLDSAFMTFGLLGWNAAWMRLVGAFLLSWVAGWVVGRVSGKDTGKSQTKTADVTEPSVTKKCSGSTSILSSLHHTALETARDIFPSLTLGILLSTFLLHCYPWLGTTYQHASYHSHQYQHLHSGFGHTLLLRLGVLLTALPLQMCEHTTVTYAAAIQKAGGSPGLAFAFLLSAPSTNLSTLSWLLLGSDRDRDPTDNTTPPKRSKWIVLRVSAAIAMTSLALSYLVDYMGMDLLVETQSDHAGHGGDALFTLPEWFSGTASPVIFLYLGCRVVYRVVSQTFFQSGACCSSAPKASCGSTKDTKIE